MSLAAIILAAGKGTRMNSDMPKVLHPIAGAPMLIHAMRTAQALEPEHIVVVAGHGAFAVREAARAYDEDVHTVLQDQQLGTGHAVKIAREALAGFEGAVLVIYGDTPFVAPQTLQKMIDIGHDGHIVVLGFEAADPGRYGRLIVQGDTLEEIVEFKDASAAQRQISLCNSGVVLCPASHLWPLLDRLSNDNAAGEYYLTDLPALGREAGIQSKVVTCDEMETLGVNTRAQLAAADALFQQRARAQLIKEGVTLLDPATTYLSYDTVIGRDSIIDPNVYFGPDVTVESGAHIRAFSHLEGAHVARGAVVGPFARLRPGTELAEDVRIGNFVEIKNAQINQGTKVNHLSYIGDALIGEHSNIGAGTITCNYDGYGKYRTVIGSNTFVGSQSALVAPIHIGDGALIGTGTVVTQNVPDHAVATARIPQQNKEGFAPKLFKILKSRAAKLKDKATGGT